MGGAFDDSCVGAWKNDGVKTIASDQDNRTTLGYATSTDTERLIGDAAEDQAAEDM